MTQTRCNRCGARLLMMKANNGKTYPCDPALVEFIPDMNGHARYVMDDGLMFYGSAPQPEDRGIHFGHMDHRTNCRKEARK